MKVLGLIPATYCGSHTKHVHTHFITHVCVDKAKVAKSPQALDLGSGYGTYIM